MYMQTKNYFRKKNYKIMYKGSNCDQKSRLSEILLEPFNPRGGCFYFLVTFCATSLNIKDIVDFFRTLNIICCGSSMWYPINIESCVNFKHTSFTRAGLRAELNLEINNYKYA